MRTCWVGFEKISDPMIDSTASSSGGAVRTSKAAGPCHIGVSIVTPFWGNEKSKYWEWTCPLS